MTKEEAIKQLEIWRECIRVDLADPDVVETYNMAIQALSFDDTKYHEEHGEVVIADVVWEDALKALKAQQEPTGDLISRQAVLDLAKFDGRDGLGTIIHAFDVERLPSTGKTGWIPLTTRPMTEEEREHYRERSDIEGYMIFDCELPEDGQEVLISYGGYVCTDTFCKDDGCYFEGVDIDDVQAWMPLPEPYKAQEGEQT